MKKLAILALFGLVASSFAAVTSVDVKVQIDQYYALGQVPASIQFNFNGQTDTSTNSVTPGTTVTANCDWKLETSFIFTDPRLKSITVTSNQGDLVITNPGTSAPVVAPPATGHEGVTPLTSSMVAKLASATSQHTDAPVSMGSITYTLSPTN